MTGIFTVVTPATDRSLLTVIELRAATRQTDSKRDAELADLGDRVSAAIVRECNVKAAGATPPTLREEAVRDVFRGVCEADSLMLSRRPVASVTSIVVDGVTLDAAEFEVDAWSAMARRLSGDSLSTWSASKITIDYVAGFSTVPADLKLAAANLAAFYWSQQDRDPLVKSSSLPGVLDESYWIGDSTKGAGMPQEVLTRLVPYTNSAAAA